MGLFRAGVRVTRALTPTPSSSSSDDDEPRARNKRKGVRTTENAPEVRFLEHAMPEKVDLFQFGDSTCQLPEGLFELSNLGDVLSLQSWNNCLSERERQCLSAYLPVMDQGSFHETLKELFSGQNMYFGSPLEDLWQQLKGGLCNPSVVKYHQTLTSLKRREYYHDLRLYHNQMLNSFKEMRGLWTSGPESTLDQRLSSWREWKSSKAIQGCLTASNNRTKMGFSSVPAGVLEDRLLRFRKDEYQSKHISCSSDEESTWHFDLEMDQGVECSHTQSRAFTEERVQSRVDVLCSETSSKRKEDVNFRDGASLMEGLHLKRKSTFQEDCEHRSKQRSNVNGYNKHSRAPASPHHEDASPSNSQHDGFRDLAFKASGLMVREPSAGVHYKVCNTVFEKQVPSSFCQDGFKSSGVKPTKLSAFVPPATPGFTFSIIHFLSAVRASLIDSGVKCLPFTKIVTAVDSCPGDLRVLQLQWPLDCLVRGVLKVLASTEKKLAINGFKQLALYDKAIRCWSWVGPVPGTVCTFHEADVLSMSEVWGISSGILNGLQNMFGNWLRNTEKTLQQLWQLSQAEMPAFPVFPDLKERFSELRAQKSLTTISPSSHEMRALFQREELVRYSALEIAFRYTTVDGQKSAVAPLRKLGGRRKPKARDHPALRPDRPSHITILSLVRDAAARLPQGIGTRADVCILLRDSQYVEDVSELQLSTVVSGALDRLHKEIDPCVRYDPEKKLWLYLHGHREEEDFDEGGTTSRRSFQKSKKSFPAGSPAERNVLSEDDRSDTEPDSGSLNGNGGSRESAPPDLHEQHWEGGSPAVVQGNVGGQVGEVLVQLFGLPGSVQPFCGTIHSHPMGWEVYKAGEELSITH